MNTNPKFSFRRWLENLFGPGIQPKPAPEPEKKRERIYNDIIISLELAPNSIKQLQELTVPVIPPVFQENESFRFETRKIVTRINLNQLANWFECYHDETVSYGYYIIIEYFTPGV